MVHRNVERRKSMNRKTKLFFSLVSLCFSVAILCFGVYSALSVSYSINGSVSYVVNDVFVKLTMNVYRANQKTPLNFTEHSQNIDTIKGALGSTIPGGEDGFSELEEYRRTASSYDEESGAIEPGGDDGIYRPESPFLDLTYGLPTEENQEGFAFYIVIDIKNLGSEIINAQITAPDSLKNTILEDSGNVEISAKGTERIVLGLALDNVTLGMDSVGFKYTITISRGSLPINEITGMNFSFNEENKTATLVDYAGSGGDVVIPDKVGIRTVSNFTKEFGSYDMMMANQNNEYLFYTPLDIELPETAPDGASAKYPRLLLDEIKNAENKNVYFPMKIQSVDSVTYTEEDLTNIEQSGMADKIIGFPISVFEESGELSPLSSVKVTYGSKENEKFFTLNKTNYDLAMGGDSSDESSKINEFVNKVKSDIRSLLPIRYSNFQYDLLVEGGEYTVTSIGDYAFSRCSNLTSIEIPSSVTSIGDAAFGYCDALQEVTFGDNSQLKSIGNYVFDVCSSLTSIDIPSSVTSIGEGAFDSCYALETVNITDIDAWAMIDFGSRVNGGSNFSIGNPLCWGDDAYLYLNEELVTEVTLTTATKIGDYAFFGYDLLTSITIPSSVTSIENSAFSGCSSLTSIEIPNSVTSIGNFAFYNCSTLETVTFGDNSKLESIGNDAFSGTQWLTNLQKTSYGIATASDGQTRFVIDVPTNITDGKLDMTNVKVIAGYAFYNCSNLTSIKIPSSVTSIGDYAFRYCDALETVSFEDDDSVWILDNTSNTEITISGHTTQVLADYLTSNYYRYTWTKKQSA